MRTLVGTLMFGLASALISTPPAASQEIEWVDLFGHDLSDWSRSGNGPTPWRLGTDHTLICDGGSEVYTPEREFLDGTLKFEYRFRPNGEKSGFKASVWARRTLQETGCKFALGDDCGSMNAVFQGASDRLKTLEENPVQHAARPIGEWNEVRLVLDGRTVTLFINDKQVGAFSQCDTTKGLIALEAEGSVVEFRNFWWKDEK